MALNSQMRGGASLESAFKRMPGAGVGARFEDSRYSRPLHEEQAPFQGRGLVKTRVVPQPGYGAPSDYGRQAALEFALRTTDRNALPKIDLPFNPTYLARQFSPYMPEPLVYRDPRAVHAMVFVEQDAMNSAVAAASNARRAYMRDLKVHRLQ